MGVSDPEISDLGINRHAGTGIVAKSFLFGEDFSPHDEEKLTGS
jgi:hypothetical protein